jgi:hypothetical protein
MSARSRWDGDKMASLNEHEKTEQAVMKKALVCLKAFQGEML